MHVFFLPKIISPTLLAKSAEQVTMQTGATRDTRGADTRTRWGTSSAASTVSALRPPARPFSHTATKRMAQTLTRGLTAASILSAGVGAAPVDNAQHLLGVPAILTPGEDQFSAYLGDWRCVTYAPEGIGQAHLGYTTPSSWDGFNVLVRWDDLKPEWSEGYDAYIGPVDATHAQGEGPWLRRRYDNNVLPTWGTVAMQAEKKPDGNWHYVADVKLRDSEAHWIEFLDDAFDSTGASFKRERRVHHVDQNWWHNDTVLCTILPNGPGLKDDI